MSACVGNEICNGPLVKLYINWCRGFSTGCNYYVKSNERTSTEDDVDLFKVRTYLEVQSSHNAHTEM